MDVEKMMLYALGVVWTFEQQTQQITISVCKIGLNDAEFVLTIELIAKIQLVKHAKVRLRQMDKAIL